MSQVASPSLNEREGLAKHGAVLQMRAAGLCGSDLHVIDDPSIPRGSIVGHEVVGQVVEVGTDVRTIGVGTTCIAPFNVSCGTCENCTSGLTSHCVAAFPQRVGATYGMGMGWAGMQAERVVVPWADNNLVILPDDVTGLRIPNFVLAADVIPTALHVLARANVRSEHTVYVAGAGPVGLAVALIARARGSRVVVGEPETGRAELLADNGIMTLDPLDAFAGSLTDQLRQHGISRVDVAVDCVGVNASSSEAVASAARTLNALVTTVRHGGTLAVPGVYPQHLGCVEMPFGLIWSKALTVVAGATPARTYVEEAVDIVRAAPEMIAPLIPTTFSFDDAIDAHRLFRSRQVTKAALQL